jgi:hypothetical protein
MIYSKRKFVINTTDFFFSWNFVQKFYVNYTTSLAEEQNNSSRKVSTNAYRIRTLRLDSLDQREQPPIERMLLQLMPKHQQ